MIIKRIDYWKENMELSRPYTITYTTHYDIQNIFIKIESDNGLYGLGSGSSSIHVTGEKADTNFVAKRDEIAEILEGKKICTYPLLIKEIRSKFYNQPALRAAIDMALYDLFCKQNKIHISELLGIKKANIHTSITIGIKGIEETIEEAKEYITNGFKIIKLKIGTEYELDLERYIKLKECIPKDIKVRVDANQGFSVIQLQDFIDKTAAAPVEFFEQPFLQGSSHQMSQVEESIRKKCAGDEDLINTKDALRLSNPPLPYGIFNIKLMKCGGITSGLRISEMAALQNIDLMWGCMDESCISISAALNTALSCSNTKYLDLDGSFDLAKDIAKGGFQVVDGIMIPDRTKYGLGVDLID